MNIYLNSIVYIRMKNMWYKFINAFIQDHGVAVLRNWTSDVLDCYQLMKPFDLRCIIYYDVLIAIFLFLLLYIALFIQDNKILKQSYVFWHFV